MHSINVMTIVNWFRVKNNADIRENPDNIDEITQMKTMKLLYYVQGVSLALYNKRAFNNEILAWKYGPIVREVYDKYHGKKSILGKIDGKDLKDFDTVEKDSDLAEIVHSVQDTYGEMSAIELMRQTHREQPWVETIRNESKTGSDVISDELIKNFFKENVLE